MKYIFHLLIILIVVNNFLPAQSLDSVSVNDSLNERKVTIIDKPKSLAELKYMIEKLDPLKQELDYLMLGGVGTAIGGAAAAVHIVQYNAWWRDEKSKFRVVNDWNYALWIDKIGHFYGTNLIAHVFSGGFEAANMQAEESAIWSASLAFLFQMYVEIEDGFGQNWGFSPGDALFDLGGALFYLGQYYFPYLKNIQPKFSYIPTEEYRNGDHDGNFIDDYEGQIYWLGFRMKQILPDDFSKYWPSFLMLSAGMGVSNLSGSGEGTREFYLALDIDWEQIPLYGGVWQFIKNTLNYFHFPMPGIRVTPNTAFFMIVF